MGRASPLLPFKEVLTRTPTLPPPPSLKGIRLNERGSRAHQQMPLAPTRYHSDTRIPSPPALPPAPPAPTPVHPPVMYKSGPK